MFTLNFPISLPDEHTYFDNGQYPVPPLPDGLSFGCISNDTAPLVLQISGFATEEDATGYCTTLKAALRIAALDSDHSITPSSASPVTSSEKRFDGSVPTVTPTQMKSLPFFMSASMQNGLHISVLSKLIGASLAAGIPAKLGAKPELALALELYSDFQFAGERRAQFIVLMTALEILLPKTSSKGKRSAVVALVKNTLSNAGYSDAKSISKELDDLYVARNALVHEAQPVTAAQLEALKKIVSLTLKALVS